MPALFINSIAHSATRFVTATNFQYTPKDLVIDVGDTVQWSGLGGGHNVAQSNGPSDTAYNGSGFFSGTPTNGIPTFQFTFNTPGLFHYLCDFHAGANMRGTITVQIPAPTPTPTPSPSNSPSATSSPTITPTFTGSPTNNISDTRTSSPTLSPSFTTSPSFSASPSISPTFTFTPSPDSSASASPTAVPLSESFPHPDMHIAFPNPASGSQVGMSIKQSARSQQTLIRIYSVAMTKIVEVDLGSLPRGISNISVPLPASMPNGFYYSMVIVKHDGKEVFSPAGTLVYLK